MTALESDEPARALCIDGEDATCRSGVQRARSGW